ncbi:SAM-dependent methyltransferase [Burkholderia cenocepacia]|uniref:SAM-dependent methyltransferase n=1 Tax=Burkholderia cenocepacia TaxID=95486 RepID=UPI000F5A4AB7|nr:class I SAM-dependent methyltransferase [Burkholderia cenocepacia]RQU50047.1 class I SAM-dependent methyltransferase [Burkholderia cenocepacia]RQV33871.1 class I SAM-dependent methyltransferase [Burkholderia cenocepacia]
MESFGDLDLFYRNSVDNFKKILLETKWLSEKIPIHKDSYSTTPSGELLHLYEEVGNGIESGLAEFSRSAQKIPGDKLSIHYEYARGQLHGLLLESPFIHHAFTKPMGYAGDYRVVNQILGSPWQGETHFASILNAAFLRAAAAQAHRNRIEMLVDVLVKQADVASQSNNKMTVLSIGCGPAAEVVRFIARYPEPNWLSITLIDSSREAVEFTNRQVELACEENCRSADVEAMRSSIQDILKSRIEGRVSLKYDLIYCAGLFDYFGDGACKRITNKLSEMLRVGGSLIFTNVHKNNPTKEVMEHLLDWHLVHRDAGAMKKIMPDKLSGGELFTDETGANIFARLENK